MAKQIVIPAPPAPPCSSRNTSRVRILGALAHNIDASTNNVMATSNGPRRPRRSLSGPAMNWPTASPIRQVVSEDCIPAGVVRSATAA
jgi:hypothetical protein